MAAARQLPIPPRAGARCGGIVRRARHPSAATYRRRRLAATVLVVGLALAARVALAALGGGALTAPEPAPALPREPAPRSHLVQPGDTLWTIGRALQPDGDVRAVVDRLAERHRGAHLQPGEVVRLPL